MKTRALLPILIFGIACLFSPANAQPVLFDFNGGPLHGPTPFDQTSHGITAHFTATGAGFSIQAANVLGFTPVDFSGYCIYPDSIYQADLLISFDHTLNGISIQYSPEEYATDSSCTMRLTAYLGASYVGTSTATIDPPGTWPTGLLSYSSGGAFDYVVIHYDQPPPTGGDYGPVFMADNLLVSPAPGPSIPEPATAAELAGLLVLGAAIIWRSQK